MGLRLYGPTRGGCVVKSVLDASFEYTPSTQTDARKTFERIRREQQAKIRQEQPLELWRWQYTDEFGSVA
jgi:hypothetical protein